MLPPGGNAPNGGGAEFWNTSPSSMKNMKDAMYESEQRRLALVEKLREAHDTLQVCVNEEFTFSYIYDIIQ